MKNPLFFMAALCAVAALAAPHSEKMLSSLVGSVALECAEADGWRFQIAETTDDRVSEITVRLIRDEPARPPKFALTFETSGVGADHVWTPYDDRYTLWPKEWGKVRYSSQLAFRAPIAAAFEDGGRNVLSLACSEAMRRVDYGLTIGSSDCRLNGRIEFFNEDEPPISAYKVTVRLDARDVFWADGVRSSAKWISDTAGFAACTVPKAARDPLYSTWYAFWQDVHAGELEVEARLAAELGMKSMILDDGWQKVKSRNYYSATGDWMPVQSRFPDMKAHVARVHESGIRNYLLWLAVPFVGDESAAWGRFKDKLLNPGTTNVGILDPRFPEVREYLVETYVRAVRDWGFDGLKLDFIDEFKVPEGGDPAEKDGYAGRDIRSIPVAVDTLMKEIVRRLSAIRPDVLLEFRQQYMGPAIRQYGNMIRATDCPADSDKIRKLVCDLRLTSGETAVHSDMLVWSPEEPPERAARPILNSLFSTIQYSMVLAKTPAPHREVIHHWIAFTEAHRAALQEGSFRPHHPELNYPLVEGESDKERVVAVYAPGLSVKIADDDKTQLAINVTGTGSLALDLSAARVADVYDTFGRHVRSATLPEGLARVDVPASGYVRLEPFGRRAPVKIVFDTDMITDYDDMGALATLHALADRGECEILATVSSTRDNASVAAIEIANAFCGRPDLPVGAPKSGSAVKGAPFGHEKYVRLREKYARWVRHSDAEDAPDAVEVYRRSLASQPDGSVVVCTVGFLTNLRDLLASKPDAISPLSGRDLVRAKVSKWVAMGGFYPWGEEYNFKGDPVASRDVLRDWPTPMVYTDGQYGKDVYTGRRLAETPQVGNPVHDVYAWTMEPRESITHRSWDQHAGHSSWDQTAVLIAVRGVDSYFTPEYGTYEMTDEKGRDEWRYDLKSPSCRVLEKTPRTRVAEIIDELMESAGRR